MRIIVLPVVISMLFAGSFVAGKYATEEIDPLTTSLGRYLIALVFLCALVGHYKPSALKVARRDIALIGLLGLSGIAGYHYFFFSSLRYTELANTAIINAISPVLTGIAASAFLGERLGMRTYMGLGITILGVIILLSRGNLPALYHGQFNTGDMLMLMAVVCWVVYALTLKALSARYSSFTLTFHAVLSGVIILGVLASSEQPLSQLVGMSGRSWYALIYMGVFASGLGYLLYTYCVSSLGPTRTSTTVYALVPLFVTVLAWVIFGQSITTSMLISAAMILPGLYLVLR